MNATPLGMCSDDPLPFQPEALPAGGVVADVVMKPRETRLLREAAAIGYHVHHGVHMLHGQLDSYRAFFGLGRPRDDYGDRDDYDGYRNDYKDAAGRRGGHPDYRRDRRGRGDGRTHHR